MSRGLLSFLGSAPVTAALIGLWQVAYHSRLI